MVLQHFCCQGRSLKAQQPCGTGRARLAPVTDPEVEGSNGLCLTTSQGSYWDHAGLKLSASLACVLFT